MTDWQLEMPNLFGAGEDGVGGPPNQAGGHFELCGDDELVRALDPGRAPAHELRGAKPETTANSNPVIPGG